MLRLRQICLVAQELAPVEEDLRAVFGLEVCHRDPGVRRFGLENVLMPVGNDFLEVVAPVEADTAAGRYLERRGGDGGYMVILQTDGIDDVRRHVGELGIRTVLDAGNEETHGIQLHPRDLPGAIAELRWNAGGEDPGGPWSPAGRDWERARTGVVRAIVAAELQTPDPAALAARWGAVLRRPVAPDELGRPTIELDNARLRFVEAGDGRGEGLGGLELDVADRDYVERAARERGIAVAGNRVTVCGTRFELGGAASP